MLRLLFFRSIIPVAVYAMEEDDHEVLHASDDIRVLADEHNIPVRICKRIAAEDLTLIHGSYKPDLILIAGWRTILPKEVYEYPRLGCVGFHDSPLPRYRGFAPVNWAVINGEREWAVTLMHIAPGVDEGDIIDQEFFPVPDRVTAPDLFLLTTRSAVRLLDRQLFFLLNGTTARIPQDHSKATYACARTPGDGEIRWRDDAVKIDRLIRGLTYPYPGAYTTWRGEKLIIWEAESVPARYEGRLPGRVVAYDKDTADVLTGDGALRIRKIGWRGEDIPAGAVFRSVRISLGREAR